MEHSRRVTLLRQIFEANLLELRAWRARTIPDPQVRTYVEILIAFHEQDSVQLQALANYLALDECAELYWLGNIRSRLLNRTLSPSYYERFLAHLGEADVLWLGEMKFVAAIAAEQLGDSALAATLFNDAAAGFAAIGALKRAERSGERSLAVQASDMTGTYESVDEPTPEPKITRLEANFLRLVREKPVTKFEAIEKLFGRQPDQFPFFEERFQEMVEGLREKYPNAWRFSHSRYSA